MTPYKPFESLREPMQMHNEEDNDGSSSSDDDSSVDNKQMVQTCKRYGWIIYLVALSMCVGFAFAASLAYGFPGNDMFFFLASMSVTMLVVLVGFVACAFHYFPRSTTTPTPPPPPPPTRHVVVPVPV